MSYDRGWGKDVGLSKKELELFGWPEYIATATQPYPPWCLDTEVNRKAYAAWQKRNPEQREFPLRKGNHEAR